MALERQPGCLLAILRLLGLQPGTPARESESLPYRRKDYLFSKAERSFFGVLQQAVGREYLIFAKVRLADLVYLPKGTPSRHKHFNRVQAKHVDFVLCDQDTVRPLLAIELDDKSHARSSRRSRDAFVDAALAAAGLPLLRVRARAAYNFKELSEQIRGKIEPASPSPVDPGERQKTHESP